MNNKKQTMSKLFLMLGVAALFTGCAQISPKPSNNNIMEANSIDGEVMTFDESEMVQTMNENDFVTSDGQSLKNSSKNGFQSTYFAFDKYVISEEMQPVIQKNIEIAAKSSGKIKLEGNCDSYGTAEYNYALGLKRAKAVKDAMVNGGIEASRIVMVSMGESNPSCETINERCMKSNRRTDLAIIQ